MTVTHTFHEDIRIYTFDRSSFELSQSCIVRLDTVVDDVQMKRRRSWPNQLLAICDRITRSLVPPPGLPFPGHIFHFTYCTSVMSEHHRYECSRHTAR